MGCNCGTPRAATVYVLTYDDGRTGGEFASRTDAEAADARRGGGGTIRRVQKSGPAASP